MKLFSFIFPLAGFLASGMAFAEGGQAQEPIIEMPAQPSRWSVGASFAPLLNVESSFSGLGSYAAPFAPQPTGGGRDYEYQDGFVRVDESGNAGGLTGYWGYENAGQYDAGSNSLSFNLSSSLANGRAGETEPLSPGFEIFGYYEMGAAGMSGDSRVSWGIKGGLHYAKISTGGSGTITSDVLRVTDCFDTAGIVLLPAPGYQGSFNGPGALIGDDPSRTVTVIEKGASVSADLDLEVDMITMTVGPYVEIPLTPEFSLFGEAGFSMSVVRGSYEYDTLTTITGVGAQAASGGETRSMILPGVYAGFSAMWKVTRHFGVHASAKYQYVDQFTVDTNGSEAGLSFDGAAVISLGCFWTF